MRSGLIKHKGKNLNADPNNREHIQDWIRGRVNHYWFDLNRDWLLLQHPESRARIAEYHQWRPNVLTDHHEMGGHSTFFFQPGIPTRKNPYTPDENVELTKELAKFHAKAFDQENKLYFTEESFDDFYAGKGSTYPDLHGTIGILFEQASSRGHLTETINGLLDFPTSIKHQVMASLSTLEGSLENKKALMDFQWDFSQSYKDIADDADIDGFIIGENKDRSRLNMLLALLEQHDIQAYPLTKDAKVDGKAFAKGTSYFIPLKQPQARLILSVFSEQTSFLDNTFYDVSSWNLAMAFNLEFAQVESKRSVKTAAQAWQPEQANTATDLPANAYSYAIDWADYKAPALVYELLEKDIKLRAALKPFSANTGNGVKEFAAGTILVNAGLQSDQLWQQDLQQLVAKYGVPVDAITSGLTAKGIDLGSRNMMPVTKPDILVAGGFGTNPYEVGETWYLLDRHLGMSPTIIEKRWLNNTDLSRYTHILLTDGSYSDKDKALLNKLKAWVKAGGVLWAQKRAAIWLAKNEVLQAEFVDSKGMKDNFDTEGLAYGDQEALAGRQRIAGAFFEAKLDRTHPLAFGFSRDTLPVFKNRTEILTNPKLPFVEVFAYTDKPLLSGYADDINVKEIAKASGLVANAYGSGVVIGMTDNPNFRAITYGTNRLLFNALFLAKAID